MQDTRAATAMPAGNMVAARRPPSNSGDPFKGHPEYTQIRSLGNGTFGQVLLARDRQGRKWAIKCIERGPSTVSEYVEREVTNLRRLQHTHIVRFKELFLTATHLCIVMEYAPDGDLAKFMNEFRKSTAAKHFDEDATRWLFQQLMFAVDYCQAMGITNRDIKLQNTLVDASGNLPIIKLCDFGFSKASVHSPPGSWVGTPAYVAPEIILNAPSGKTYDGKMCDIWSCGVMLYVMLTGKFPFGWAANPADKAQLELVFKKVCSAQYDQQAISHCSEAAKDLLARILVVDPQQRITMDGIFSHPWFVKLFVGQDTQIPFQMVNAALAQQPLPAGLQTEEQLLALCEKARTLPHPAAAALAFDIEDVIENEFDEIGDVE